MPKTHLTARLALALCAWLATAALLRAEDRLYKTSLPLKTPRKQESALGAPKDVAEFTCWVPDGVKVLRGAVCNPFAKPEAPGKHWQEAARLWGFAFVHADFDGVRAEEYVLLQRALKDLAEKSGHPEVEHLPLCFLGMSRGGGMSTRLAELMPGRTIAVAPVCLEVGPTSPATRAIPVVTIFGEKDGRQMALLGEKLPVQRKEGARWATAVQWGRGHEFALANNLVLPFFDDVIRRRVPHDQTAVAGPVKLNDFPEGDGWLGDPSGWGKEPATIASFDRYPKDRGAACWLPSARTAAVWQAFVSPSRDVRIAAPPGLGDKQPFVPHAAGPVKTTAEVGGDVRARKVELFDGDIALGESGKAPFVFEPKLTPGVHSLIVRVTTEDGKTLLSRPHTRIVTRE